MTPLAENVAALERSAPGIGALLVDDQATELVQTASGCPTLRYHGVMLHSSRDPRTEAARAVADLCRRSPPLVLMYGLGLGYQAQALIEGTSDTTVVVVEPSPSVLTAALAARPIAELLDHPRLQLILAPEPSAIDAVLPGYLPREFDLFRMPNRSQFDTEHWEALDATVRRVRNRHSINRNTIDRFGRRWVANLLTNIPVLAKAVGVHALEGRFQDTPALIVAAGPTLDESLAALPALAKRMLIIAVDTAISACERVGVTPDISVVVDPQYWNTRHLDRLDATRSILVAEPATHPVVFRRFAGPHVLCSSLFPLGRYLESALGRFGTLGAGGSVATTAWDLARVLGCSSIAATGLDLGFPAGRTHCAGSFFEETTLVVGTRRAPAETALHRYRSSGDPYDAPAADGSMIVSDRRMEVYRQWFEDQLRRGAAPPTFRLSPHGLDIAGMGITTDADLLHQPPIRRSIEATVRALRAELCSEPDGRADALQHAVTELDGRLAHLARLAQAAVRVLDTAAGTESGIDLSPLAPIDEAIVAEGATATEGAGEIVAFLLQDAIHRITGGFGSGSLTDQLAASRDLYQGLLDSCTFQRDRLFRTIPIR